MWPPCPPCDAFQRHSCLKGAALHAYMQVSLYAEYIQRICKSPICCVYTHISSMYAAKGKNLLFAKFNFIVVNGIKVYQARNL